MSIAYIDYLILEILTTLHRHINIATKEAKKGVLLPYSHIIDHYYYHLFVKT